MTSDSPAVSPGPSGPKPPAGVVARAVAGVPAPGLVLVSIVSIQLGAVVAVNLFAVLGPVGTALLRLAFSAVLLLVATRRSISWRAARPHAGVLLAYGAILGVMNLSFYGAIDRIPLGIAVAIEFVGPLGLAAVTSRRLVDFAWIGLAGLGLVLLSPDVGVGLDPLGVALAGVAGLCWAGFALMSQRVGRALPGHSGLAIGMAVAALVVLPVDLALGGVWIASLDAVVVLATLLVAVLSTAIPWSLEFEALKRMAAKTYGILVTLEPAVAATVGAILLNQAMGPEALLAIACITAAGLGVTLSDRRDAGAIGVAHESVSGGADEPPH